jgi:hypothetical protein
MANTQRLFCRNIQQTVYVTYSDNSHWTSCLQVGHKRDKSFAGIQSPQFLLTRFASVARWKTKAAQETGKIRHRHWLHIWGACGKVGAREQLKEWTLKSTSQIPNKNTTPWNWDMAYSFIQANWSRKFCCVFYCSRIAYFHGKRHHAEKLTVAKVVIKFPAFWRRRKLINEFSRFLFLRDASYCVYYYNLFGGKVNRNSIFRM